MNENHASINRSHDNNATIPQRKILACLLSYYSVCPLTFFILLLQKQPQPATREGGRMQLDAAIVDHGIDIVVLFAICSLPICSKIDRQMLA